MIKKTIMKKLFTFFTMTVLLATYVSAQPRLLTEDFNYTNGDLTTVSGGVWSHLSGTSNPIQVISNSLTYPGYVTNPTVNSGKIMLDSSSFNAEAVFTKFTRANHDTVYYSFLLNVFTTHNLVARDSLRGETFISFLASNDNSIRKAGVAIKRGGVANTFKLGILVRQGVDIVWTNTDYPIRDTLLVTVGYQFIAGDSNNIADLWVNPPTTGAQPTPDAQVTDVDTGGERISKLALFQRSRHSPVCELDAIKVDTAWSSTILPLKLLSFSVINNNGFASLSWKTADEINVNRFEIQRSADARSFAAVGNVAAKNTSTGATYSYTDPKPLAGVAYYRLNMIDNDGRSSYSGVVSINGKVPVTLSVFPNPVVNSLVLSHPKADASAVIKIVSLNGSVVGTYSVQKDAIQTSLDVSKLAKGNYIVIYHNAQQQQTTKILKQ
jgi:hypothetical protein